ncbi:MAG TPA: alcohol dehydrogenase, partial [Rhodobacterales bacterium]|nr:alcohol dehydrogenase [Rhodobacterales bacterium]
TVLVTGASGGVGSAAVQIASARGARVIAVSASAKAEALRALGAERVIDRSGDLVAELGANSVDVVIDLVGGPGWPALIEVLRPRGRYAVSGAIGGAEVALDLRQLYIKDLTFFGCTVLDPGVFARLVGRIEHGEIKPLVAMTFPLREIAAAQEAFGEKRHVGKIVLTVE